ncbi:MAG TPA: amino acid ABC transporter substrate-binding protein [Pseudomonas sp.]|nr:amino acid ABC transporter substrate-binding protein [Pseudomonas sp.]
MNVRLPKPVHLLLGCLAMLPLLATADTLERVRSNNTVTLGYLPDLAPFSSESNGTVSGFSVALCLRVVDQLKAELGLPDLQVKYAPLSAGSGPQAVSSGQVDLFCTPAPETLELRKTVSFSIPVYTGGLAVAVSKDASPELLNVLNGEVAHTGPTWRATINRGLANHTYASIEGGITEAWIREEMRLLGVVATLVTVKNHQEGLRNVAEGKVDAFFGERMVLKSTLANTPEEDEQLMVLDRLFNFVPAGLALAREDEDFRLLVDTVLSDMYHSGEMELVYRKYLGDPGDATRMLFKVYALP